MEVHCANGYIIDQFLKANFTMQPHAWHSQAVNAECLKRPSSSSRCCFHLQSSTNKRTDQYGGPIENRVRFALEVCDCTCDDVRCMKALAPLQYLQRGMCTIASRLSALLYLSAALSPLPGCEGGGG